MKIAHINFTDAGGGAAIAALRICKAQREYGLDAKLYVIYKKTNNNFVIELNRKNSFFYKVHKKIFTKLFQFRFSQFKTKNPILHSENNFSFINHKTLNALDCDIVHLHWIHENMISIKEIGNITKPLVWTLHDSWVFCGAEHHPFMLENDTRFIDAYTTKASWQKGPDIPKIVFHKKIKFWKKLNPCFIAPSTWEKNLLDSSYISKENNWQSFHIPNITIPNDFYPIDKTIAKKALGIDIQKKVIGFGAAYDIHDKVDIKGGHLLLEALQEFEKTHANIDDYLCIIFGPAPTSFLEKINIPVLEIGFINSTILQKIVYNACDTLVVPSLVESFSLIILEAKHCAVPSVAFDASGTKDVIIHKKSGYLASSYNTKDLAKGIDYCLENAKTLAISTLQDAKENYDMQSLVTKHKELYLSLLENTHA